MRKRALASLLAATIAATSPAFAGDSMSPSESASMIAAISIVAPFFLAGSAVTAATQSVKESPSLARPDKVRPVKAMPLPPMRVASKRKLDGDTDEVVLVPLNARSDTEQAVLRFPVMKNSPAESMTFGDVVTFMPASEANGWWVKSETGKNLAYVPTTSTAQLSGSRAL